jgi:hypothetical protein
MLLERDTCGIRVERKARCVVLQSRVKVQLAYSGAGCAEKAHAGDTIIYLMFMHWYEEKVQRQWLWKKGT